MSSDHSELVTALATRLAEGTSSKPEASHHELAEACLAMIASRGFEIQKVADGIANESAVPANKDARVVLDKLKDGNQLKLGDVLKLWRHAVNRDDAEPAELYVAIGERVLRAGEPLIAYDILNAGMQHWPASVRLKQLLALSLARSGATVRAAELLTELFADGNEDEETLSLLARTHKDRWETEVDPKLRVEHLRAAHGLYRRGYDGAVERDSPDGILYAGINAATMAVLLGDTDEATEIASHVDEICRNRLEENEDYWAMATLGECALIKGDLEQAAEHYRNAVRVAGRNYADIGSTRRNAAILLKAMNQDTKLLSEWFPIPKLAIFTGHLIDVDPTSERFPHSQIAVVRSKLQELLAKHNVGFGYSAAACGGDLLFVDALRHVEGEFHLVLPMAKDSFVRASVAVDQSHDWLPDFERALEFAAHVSIVNDFSETAEPLHFEYSNQVMTGLAILHSQSLGAEIVPIAVWDGQPARGPGGTGSLVDFWKNIGWQPHVIDPANVDSVVSTKSKPVEGLKTAEPSLDDFEKETCALLFADVVGYSQITEEEIPLFVREFMGRIATEVEESGVTIETGNTWGDAIYFVFRSVEDAGLTALRIIELVNTTDWEDKGFARQLSLRIGLHVGPVYRFIDPVTKSATHTGAHVSRAARIEPIAPPGVVYASEAFAALAAAEGVKTFRCDYVGITPMAKGYGDFATYHVRRKVKFD